MDAQNAVIAGGFADTQAEQMEHGGGMVGSQRHTSIMASHKRHILCQPQQQHTLIKKIVSL